MVDVNVQDVIDRQRIGRLQWTTLLLCTFIMFVDGLDVYVIGKIAPAIAADFGRPVAAMSAVFTAQQIGLAIGAFAIGPLSDRYGRRSMLILSAASFGLLTIAGIFAPSLEVLAGLRLLAGLFLSGVLPVSMALVSEMTPKQRRATFIAIIFIGYSLGNAGGALIAAWLLADYGWQSAFWIGGLLPLLFVPIMLAFGTESLQFRVKRDPTDPSIPQTLRALEPDLPLADTSRYTTGDNTPVRGRGAGIGALFSGGRSWTTAMLWAACFFSMGNIALLSSWNASFFFEMGGITIQRFALMSMIAVVGGLTGTLTVGFFMDRFRPTRVIAIFFLLNAATIVGLGQAPFGTTAFTLVLFAWGLTQTGGQAGINVLASQSYPTAARATGISWAGGSGRIGGVLGPLAGGLALSNHLTLQQTYLLIALPALAVMLLILMLERDRKTGDTAPAALPA